MIKIGAGESETGPQPRRLRPRQTLAATRKARAEVRTRRWFSTSSKPASDSNTNDGSLQQSHKASARCGSVIFLKATDVRKGRDKEVLSVPLGTTSLSLKRGA